MAVRLEKIVCTVLREALGRQVEETMETFSEGPEAFYKSYLDCELERGSGRTGPGPTSYLNLASTGRFNAG